MECESTFEVSAKKEALLRGFDHSCGGCHSEQITDYQVSVVSIPVNLFESTENADAHEISNEFVRSAWIEKYETGIMRLLLASDPEVGAARNSLVNWRKEEETDSSTNAVQEELRDAAQRYAVGMKELVTELLDAQVSKLAERLAKVETADTHQGNRPRLASTLLPDLRDVDRQKLLRLMADDETSSDETSDGQFATT